MSHYNSHEVNESEPTPIERSKSLRHAYAWKQNAYRTTHQLCPVRSSKRSILPGNTSHAVGVAQNQ